MQSTDKKCHAGFTLVEMLVVIAIIGVLAGLAIYFVPTFQTHDRAARGAGQFQQWFNTARQQAIRNQRPYGLRLLFEDIDTSNAADPIIRATKCQLIEQPDDIGGGRHFVPLPAPGRFASLQLESYLSPPRPAIAGYSPDQLVIIPGANFVDQSVQAGDHLELNGSGLIHRINEVRYSDPPANTIRNVLALVPGIPNPAGLPHPITEPIREFRILRQPRVVGDETFDLPRTVVIDYAPNLSYGLPPPLTVVNATTSYRDILFSPTGNVLRRDLGADRVTFWVRSTDEDDVYGTTTTPTGRYQKMFGGQPSLVVVYVQSGLVASYPVDAGNDANPYSLVR